MKRKTPYIFVVTFIALGAVLYFFYGPAPNGRAKCPDDYPNTDTGSAEYLKDFDEWTNNFYDKNPNATLPDWSRARYQFWIDNNCAEALKRYNEAKSVEADPKVIEMIENTIQDKI